MTDIGDHEAFSADELSAAEYALGVLSGAERAAAAQREGSADIRWRRPFGREESDGC